MNVIAREPSQRGPIKRLVVDGAPVIAHYDLLMSLLKLSLDENELGIFAEPVIDDGDSVVSWGARSGNPLVSIRQVTPGERMLLIKQRDKIIHKIEAQIEDLRARGESGQITAEVLAAALVTPDKYASMFTDGSGPVLIDWGSAKDEGAGVAIVTDPVDDPELTIVEVAPDELEDAGEIDRAQEPVIPDDVIHWDADASEALDEAAPVAAWRRHASAMNVATAFGVVAFLAVLVATGISNVFSPSGTGPQALTGEDTAAEEQTAAELALNAPVSAASSDPARPDATAGTVLSGVMTDATDLSATPSATDSGVPAAEKVAALPPIAANAIAPSVSPVPPAKSTVGIWGDEPVVASATPALPTGIAPEFLLSRSQAMLGPVADDAVRTAAPQAPDKGVGATLASWNPEAIPAVRLPSHPTESELEALLDQAKADPAQAPDTAFGEVPAQKAAVPAQPDSENAATAAASPTSDDPDANSMVVESTRTDPAEAQRAAQERLATIENGLGLRRSDRRALQRRLLLLGFNPRGVDGLFGGNTRAAISLFQQAHGYPVTGYLDPRQVGLIGRLSDKRYAAWRDSARAARAAAAATQQAARQATADRERPQPEQPKQRQQQPEPRQQPIEVATLVPTPRPEKEKRKRGFLGLFGLASADPDAESTGFGESPDNDRGGGDGSEGDGAGDASGGGGAGGGSGGGGAGGAGSDGGSGDSGGGDSGGGDSGAGADGGADGGGDGGADGGGDGGADGGGDGGADGGGDGGADGGGDGGADGGGDGGADGGGDGGADGGSDGGSDGGGGGNGGGNGRG